jgi:hypothetical protein
LPTTLQEKLVKIGARVIRHGRYITFQLPEAAKCFGIIKPPIGTGAGLR